MLDHNNPLNFMVSIGVSIYPAHGIRSEVLVTKADAALYQATKEGRNRIALEVCNEPAEIPTNESVVWIFKPKGFDISGTILTL